MNLNNEIDLEGMDLAGDETIQRGTKRVRNVISPIQLVELNRVLAKGNYPSTEVREELSKRIGMTSRKVQVWFQNKRQTQKKTREEGSLSTPDDSPPSLRGFSTSPPSPLLPLPFQFNRNSDDSYKFNSESDSGASRQRSSSSASGSGTRRLDSFEFFDISPGITLPPLGSIFDDFDTPRGQPLNSYYPTYPSYPRQPFQEPIQIQSNIQIESTFQPPRKISSFLPRFSRSLSGTSSPPRGSFQSPPPLPPPGLPNIEFSNSTFNTAAVRPLPRANYSSSRSIRSSSVPTSVSEPESVPEFPFRNFNPFSRPSQNNSSATNNILPPIRRSESFAPRTLPSIGLSLESGFNSFQAEWESREREREESRGSMERMR